MGSDGLVPDIDAGTNMQVNCSSVNAQTCMAIYRMETSQLTSSHDAQSAV